jgi:hypothetical protein
MLYFFVVRPYIKKQKDQKANAPESKNDDVVITTSGKDKNVSIALASILLAAFFMPWISESIISISAWDMVFSKIGENFDSPIRFIIAIVPISSFIIIYSVGFNKEKFPFSPNLLFASPLVAFIITVIIIINKLAGNNSAFHNPQIDELIKVFAIGFWLTLICSTALAFIGRDYYSLKKYPEKTEAIQNISGQQNLNNNQTTIVDQLEKLQGMKRDGLISDEDYQKTKDKIISSFD